MIKKYHFYSKHEINGVDKALRLSRIENNVKNWDNQTKEVSDLVDRVINILNRPKTHREIFLRAFNREINEQLKKINERNN